MKNACLLILVALVPGSGPADATEETVSLDDLRAEREVTEFLLKLVVASEEDWKSRELGVLLEGIDLSRSERRYRQSYLHRFSPPYFSCSLFPPFQ